MGRKDLTAERQDIILDAMERCIVKYGLQGTTLKNIASEAQVNRGLLHHYIGNRDEIFQMMAERLIERYQTNFGHYAATRPDHDPEEIVMDYYFGAWFDLAPQDDALILELLAESGRDPHIQSLLLNLYTGFERMIARELNGLYPNAKEHDLHSVSYSLMLLAFAHASITWLGLPIAKQSDVRSIAANLIQTLK
jgi:AcrR family transcriptional regulator